MKNYYELLEVSENASSEVIEKAYKTLVKKYHPDLQPENKKKEAENKIKEINEAYEILSNSVKKSNYDNELKLEKKQKEQAKYANFNQTQNRQSTKNTYSQNNYSNTNYNYTSGYNNTYSNNVNSNNYNTTNTQNSHKRVIREPHKNTITNNYANFQDDYTEMMNDAYNNAYNDAFNQAYINNLKNMGYEIHYERPLKEKIRIAISIIAVIFIMSIIGLILWQIPPIKHYFTDLYNTNEGFRLLVNIIGGIFRGIINIFKK